MFNSECAFGVLRLVVNLYAMPFGLAHCVFVIIYLIH